MIIYILIGIIFMFCVEYLLNLESIQEKLTDMPRELGWTERVLGILFWPICLSIFLYNFLKEFFK